MRLGGIGNRLAPEIEQRTGFETRVDDPRPRAARRHAHRVRPRPRDPLRPRGDRRGRTTATSGRWSRCSGTDIVRVPIDDAVERAQDRRRPACRRGRASSSDDADVGRRRWALPLDDLIALLELEPLEVNLFRGVEPDEDRQRVFGGQVAGQALVAAGRTVDADRPVHSLHAYFLRPGRPDGPDHLRGRPHPRRHELHDPARRRDPARPARSSTSRRRSRSSRTGPTTTTPMPDVPAPEELPTFQERLEPYLDRFGAGHGRLARARAADRLSGRSRIRSWIDPAPREPTQDVWIQANGTLPDDPLLHACVVAYASDLTLLDTAMLPHAIGSRRRVPDREPRPRDVVPPPVPRRRVAAVPPDEPVGVGRARARARATSSRTRRQRSRSP